METILSIKNLDKKFGNIHAVKNLTFEVKKGEIYGILGPNGSGKSTTLGIILNVVNRTSGEFSWFNNQMETHDALKHVGAIIERPNFYPYMSALQNLRLICKIKGISEEKIDEKLKIVNLFDRKKDKFRTYSLGMKQRLAIASALLNDPKVLILDEPTNGLDPQGIHEIREIIMKIAKSGTTILLASHLLDEVEKVCTHVLVIQKGKKLYSGPVDEMTASKGIIEVKANDVSLNILKEILAKHPDISTITEKDEILSLKLENDISASSINKYLFDNKITASHLVKRNLSLEQQFLNLTNN